MNITFMIGNGFDINLGLSTRYSDFIEVYRNIQSNDDVVIQKFKKEIIDCNLPLWSNAELAFGQQTSFISDDFTVENYSKCHSDFCRALAKYLKDEQKKLVLSKENAQIMADIFSKAVNHLSIGFRAIPSDSIQSLISSYNELMFHFIDFNYTNTLDRICSETNRLIGWGSHKNYKNTMGQLVHAHGTVDKDMVLGVSDETQIANLKCFKAYDEYYLAQLIKSQTDLINEENTYNQTLKILDSSNLIYVYGMSLGETDKFWWERICKLLVMKETLRVIIHSYDAPEDDLLRFDIRRYQDAQRNKLFELGNISDEIRNKIQGRVHITGANIFHELTNFVTPKQQAIAS